MLPLTGRGRSRAVTALLLAAVAVVGGLPSPAGAEPATSVSEARRELAALNRTVDIAVEDYAAAQLTLASARRRAAAAAARAAREQQRLAAARSALSDLVAAVYTSGGTHQVLALVTSSSPTDFLDRATTLDTMARSRTRQVRDAQVLRRRVQAQQARAATLLATAEELESRSRRARSAIEAQVARQQSLLNRVESAQARRDRLAREARAAGLARQDRLRRASRDRETTTPGYSGSASGRAAVAVQAAYAQLGKPYRWGAAGPDRFDCSGLTMYVWAKAGVSLPHSSRAQRHAGRSVSRGELRPGDLVFRGSPTIHHVGIYIGDGRMISAPQTGDVVKISNAFAGEYVGAVRL
ncbi:MAG TPA: NlpC/P60 family protein [Mycobacteriales bacterium]|nr:NlpC/P60 family protein [Mycobacteriales bacterium]